MNEMTPPDRPEIMAWPRADPLTLAIKSNLTLPNPVQARHILWSIAELYAIENEKGEYRHFNL